MKCTNRFCKVHYYWDFQAEWHMPLPFTCRYLSSQFGWVQQSVHVGPPGYEPRKPRPDQWEAMRRTCPHQQMDLTCNTCLRHTFRPWSPA